ncbi:MAG: hypothetical protein P9L96_05745 [Candidatus Gygaella obscura]|nr:hypothetical protein [Candidatus Gygaella obscura]
MNKKRLIIVISAVLIVLIGLFICSYICILRSQVCFLTRNIDKINKNVEDLQKSAQTVNCLQLKDELVVLRRKVKGLESKLGRVYKDSSDKQKGNAGYLMKDGKINR